jgi:hypothetical protein
MTNAQWIRVAGSHLTILLGRNAKGLAAKIDERFVLPASRAFKQWLHAYFFFPLFRSMPAFHGAQRALDCSA